MIDLLKLAIAILNLKVILNALIYIAYIYKKYSKMVINKRKWGIK